MPICVIVFLQAVCSLFCLYGLYGLRPLLPLGGAAGVGKRSRGGVSPLILVHPALQSPAAWYFCQAAFRKAGFARIYYFEYSCRERTLGAVAGRLAELVNTVARNNPGTRPVLIGASLGGLIARQALCLLDRPERLGGLITLACPHKGSRLASLTPGRLLPLLRAISYNSRAIRDLEAEERNAPVLLPKTAFYSSYDEVVKPAAALLPPAGQGWRAVRTPPLSHMAIMLHRPTIRAVIRELEGLRPGQV